LYAQTVGKALSGIAMVSVRNKAITVAIVLFFEFFIFSPFQVFILREYGATLVQLYWQ
jgi:hypothetical protein